MTLNDNATAATTEGECVGYGGFNDIGPDTSVVVSDASGTIVATGRLAPATSYTDGVCMFPFTVADVPTGSDFYRVEVSRRGEVTFDAERAKNGDVP